MDQQKREELLLRADELFTEGRLEEALGLAGSLDPDDPERWLLTMTIWLEVGATAEAEAALVELRRTAPDDPLTDQHEGRLRLDQWRLNAARTLLERVPAEVGGAALPCDLALLEDLEGSFAAADAHLARAHRQWPDLVAAPVRLAPEEFRALVHEAAQDLPDEFRAAFETMAVVIDPMPTAAVVGAPESGHPPDVLGLFSGLPLHENEARGHGELPATIFLFQRNLERIAPDRDTLREEVRVTLYHELGHALGFDEEGVDDLGLR